MNTKYSIFGNTENVIQFINRNNKCYLQNVESSSKIGVLFLYAQTETQCLWWINYLSLKNTTDFNLKTHQEEEKENCSMIFRYKNDVEKKHQKIQNPTPCRITMSSKNVTPNVFNNKSLHEFRSEA